jgi:hypothetical protein
LSGKQEGSRQISRQRRREPQRACPSPAHQHTLRLPCLQRNLFLASDAEARFARTQRRALSGAKAGKDRAERPARAEDLVRLYDALIAAVLELNELAAHVGGAAGEMLMDLCAAKVGG